MKDSMPHIDGSFALEGPAASQQFIEQYSNGKNICSSVDTISASLFRCSVRCCAIRDADFRQLGMMNA